MSEEKLPANSGLFKEVIPDLVYRITFWDGLEHAPEAGEGHPGVIVLTEDAGGNIRGRAGEHVIFKGWGILEAKDQAGNWIVVGAAPRDEIEARYAPVAVPAPKAKKAAELESGDQNLKVKV